MLNRKCKQLISLQTHHILDVLPNWPGEYLIPLNTPLPPFFLFVPMVQRWYNKFCDGGLPYSILKSNAPFLKSLLHIRNYYADKQQSSTRDALPKIMMDSFQYNLSPNIKHSQNILKHLAINFSSWFSERYYRNNVSMVNM